MVVDRALHWLTDRHSPTRIVLANTPESVSVLFDKEITYLPDHN